ncbi:unnamed protein product [Closterium sp. NIES-54]
MPEGEKSAREQVDRRRCHTCGEPGHLKRDCPSVPTCNRCRRRGHRSNGCYQARAGAGGQSKEDLQVEIRKLQARLEWMPKPGGGSQAMLAIEEIAVDELTEEELVREYGFMVHPRERSNLDLRPRSELSEASSTNIRRERGPARRDGASSSEMRRHPNERMVCQASVFIAEKGSLTVGGLPMGQGIIDMGAYHVIFGKGLVKKLKLDLPKMQVERGILLMTAEGESRNGCPVPKGPWRSPYYQEYAEEGQKRIEQYEEGRRASDLKERVSKTWCLDGALCILELYGGIGTGLAAALKAGCFMGRWIHVEKDPVVRKVARHHVLKLQEEYPQQMLITAFPTEEEVTVHDVRDITEQELEKWGPIDLVIAGWECQGYSRAGEGRGMDDPRGASFRDLERVLRMIQRKEREVVFILENVDMADDKRELVKQAFAEIQEVLGRGVPADAAQLVSRAHRPRRY